MSTHLESSLRKLEIAYLDEDEDGSVPLEENVDRTARFALGHQQFDWLDDAASEAGQLSASFLVESVTRGIYDLSRGRTYLGAIMVPVAVMHSSPVWNENGRAIIPLRKKAEVSFLRQTLARGDPQASYYPANHLIRAEALWGFDFSEVVSGLFVKFQSGLRKGKFSPGWVRDCMARVQMLVEGFYQHRQQGPESPPNLGAITATMSLAAWPVFVAGVSDVDLELPTELGEAMTLRGAGLIDFPGDPRKSSFLSGARTSIESALGDGSKVFSYAPMQYWQCSRRLASIRQSLARADREAKARTLLSRI